MSDEGAKPLPVISAVEGIDASQIALHVTPDEVIALRRTGSIVPALLMSLLILLLLSPMGYSLYRELTRKGMTAWAETLLWVIGLLLLPTVLVMIATLRRRKLERGLKLIDNIITVLTPDETIGVTTFPVADLKDVNIVSDPSFTIIGQVCRLVLVRHVGGNVTVFRGCRYSELQNVAKALYPRMRVRVKGFEVKTGEEVPPPMLIDDTMRNHALHFSLEWGPERSIPLAEKLRRVYPQMDDVTVNHLDRLCNEVSSFAWRQYERAFAKGITEAQASRNILEKYPFVNSDNLSHLHTQGMYYAWKG